MTNNTVGFTQVATLLCPSESQVGRAQDPWGSTNYHGNHGGPGVIKNWSGTIVQNFTAYPQAWWGHDSNLGYFGFQNPIGLLVGSEGTLGILTRVELELLPAPPGFVGGMAFFRDLPAALSFVRAADLSRQEQRIVQRHYLGSRVTVKSR